MSNSHQDSSESRFSLHRETKRKFPRGRILKAAVASFAACAMTLPALGEPVPLAPPTIVTGTAVATITVNFKVAPPSGSTVSCGLSLISSDPRSPADSQTVTATVSGATAICHITMPYKWRLTSTSLSSDTMTIAYSVQGPVQSSFGLTNIIPMPPSGTTKTISIDVTQ